MSFDTSYIGTKFRRLSSNFGLSKQVSVHTSSVKTKSTSPTKIVNPMEEYAKQKLEAWMADKSRREAEEKVMKAQAEEKKKRAAERASLSACRKEQRRLKADTRLAILRSAMEHQKQTGFRHPLTVGGCAKFVRPEEYEFFHDHQVPRQHGIITCFTCKRDKQPALRHDACNPVDETFPCFMCSKPVGWVYYCPDCSWKTHQ